MISEPAPIDNLKEGDRVIMAYGLESSIFGVRFATEFEVVTGNAKQVSDTGRCARVLFNGGGYSWVYTKPRERSLQAGSKLYRTIQEARLAAAKEGLRAADRLFRQRRRELAEVEAGKPSISVDRFLNLSGFSADNWVEGEGNTFHEHIVGGNKCDCYTCQKKAKDREARLRAEERA